ncbi:hypothetical protein AKO1_011647, partial [Acrasis kona]
MMAKLSQYNETINKQIEDNRRLYEELRQSQVLSPTKYINDNTAQADESTSMMAGLMQTEDDKESRYDNATMTEAETIEAIAISGIKQNVGSTSVCRICLTVFEVNTSVWECGAVQLHCRACVK